MIYFAGLFDAEGYVSLCPNGAFTIAIEMTNELSINMLKDTFQGSIYSRKRDQRKNSWIWKINSIADQAMFFIDSIFPHSVVKHNQLDHLGNYLNNSRDFRKNMRSKICSQLSQLKVPINMSIDNVCTPSSIPTTTEFFQWLAGFLDGDGNFVCYEYIDPRNQKKYFSHQIAAFNTHPQAISFIKKRLDGSVYIQKAKKHPIFKWVCKREIQKSVCESIMPFLKIKSTQCQLLMEFFNFPKRTRNIDYSIEDRTRLYEIINQIKHLNSL